MSTAPSVPPDKRFAPPTPFARLMYTHAASACADACVAASLAGSIFFQGAASGDRDKTLLYLLLTMAPFAIVAPLLGPALDRTKGGRRLLIALSVAGRALLCVLLSQYVTKGGEEGLLIYPLAFSVLVLAKGYSVAKSSLVPALVEEEGELVRANSRLALVSLIASAVGGAPALGVQQLLGGDYSLILAACVFAAATVLAIKIPRVEGLHQLPSEVRLEEEELHQPSILLAGSAMAVMRAAVGMLVFFTVFSLKGDIAAASLAAAFAGAGGFAGNFVAPMMRERMPEERILLTAMLTTTVLVMLAAFTGGTFGFALAGLGVGVGAASSKLGFDSLLQRDGPDAVRGRAFAKFETRFQIAWVIGSLIGLIPLDDMVGLLALALLVGFAASSYFAALQAARGRVYRTTIRPKVVGDLVGKAKSEISQRRQRSRGMRRRRRAAAKQARQAATDEDDTTPSLPGS
ncbi:MAG: MFS transporter [Actinobacteria bacterium]|nr:MFS transporter [Actinomycetota bacterium]